MPLWAGWVWRLPGLPVSRRPVTVGRAELTHCLTAWRHASPSCFELFYLVLLLFFYSLMQAIHYVTSKEKKTMNTRCLVKEKKRRGFITKIRRGRIVVVSCQWRIQFVCKTTILDHNFGYQKATVLKSLKIDSEALERYLEIQDKVRKKRSTAIKAPKRITRSAKNTTEYNPWGF